MQRTCWNLLLLNCKDKECVKNFLICPPDPCSEECEEAFKVTVIDRSESTEVETGGSSGLVYEFEMPKDYHICPGEVVYTGNGFIRNIKIALIQQIGPTLREVGL